MGQKEIGNIPIPNTVELTLSSKLSYYEGIPRPIIEQFKLTK